MSRIINPKNKDNENIKNNNLKKKNKVIIKDLSKSTVLTNWIPNPFILPDIIPLQECNTKKSNKKKADQIVDKIKLNINDVKLNTTITDILNNMDTNRKLNKNAIHDYNNIVKNFDSNPNKFPLLTDSHKIVPIDISNNSLKEKLLTYKPTDTLDNKTLNDLLNTIDKEYNYMTNKSSLFKYHTTDNLDTRTRRRSIYYPPPIVAESLKAIIPAKKKINIRVEITSLDDLIKLIEDYPLKIDVEYNIKMNALHNIKNPLHKLKNMIGMEKLKNAIVDQILYFIQDFHKNISNVNHDFMHTVIYGPPGTGKTEIAKIIGNIFSRLGVLNKNYFKKVTRTDLVAGYLGQTAIKTRNIIKECLGGVLFIDEAYALGNSEKRDSFAKECIDTLCEGLSDNKENLMVIIAGYEEELKKCFFAYNAGLESRFTWRFKTDDYTYEELFLIFKKKIGDIGWKLNDEIKKYWFEDKMEQLTYFGRDIETLLAKVKIAHGRRVFCLPIEEKTIITLKDLTKGFDMFINNNKNENSKQEILNHMYC